MLQLLDDFDGSAAARRQLTGAFAAAVADVVASQGRGARDQVARAEADVKADPARALRFDADGYATVYAAGRRHQGGRFAVPRLCELRARALAAREQAGRPAARLRLWVFDGAS